MTALHQFLSEGHQEPRNDVVSLSLAAELVQFERETFQFDHNALT